MLFGKTKEDKSVYVNVEGFNPYFYVEIDSRWRLRICDKNNGRYQKTVYPANLKRGLISYKNYQSSQISWIYKR